MKEQFWLLTTVEQESFERVSYYFWLHTCFFSDLRAPGHGWDFNCGPKSEVLVHRGPGKVWLRLRVIGAGSLTSIDGDSKWLKRRKSVRRGRGLLGWIGFFERTLGRISTWLLGTAISFFVCNLKRGSMSLKSFIYDTYNKLRVQFIEMRERTCFARCFGILITLRSTDGLIQASVDATIESNVT